VLYLNSVVSYAILSMVKVVKVQKQPFSFYRHFKICARHGFGLVGHVGAVTTLERLASPCWLSSAYVRCYTWSAMATLAWLWPGRHWLLAHGAAATACVAGRCCHWPRCAAVLRLAARRAAATTCAVTSPSCLCLPLHLYVAVGPVRCRFCRAHVVRLAVALSLMALRHTGHVGRNTHTCVLAPTRGPPCSC